MAAFLHLLLPVNDGNGCGGLRLSPEHSSGYENRQRRASGPRSSRRMERRLADVSAAIETSAIKQ
jgi:hypothetical protein